MSRLRVAVVGNGGAGKSVIAGTVARLLAGRGERVLALDSDLVPGLAISLGAEQAAEPPLNAAAERPEDGRWRLKRGVGPVRAVQRYATEARDGVRLLSVGKTRPEGLAATLPSLQAFYQVVHGLAGAKTFENWSFVGDLSAGPRQLAFDWAPYARTVLIVVEPSSKSALTARRIAQIGRSRRTDVDVVFVANKVRRAGDARRIERLLRERPFASIPHDSAVEAADRLAQPLIDHAPSSAAVHAIRALVDELEGRVPFAT